MKDKLLKLVVLLFSITLACKSYGIQPNAWPKKYVDVMWSYGGLKQVGWIDFHSHLGIGLRGGRTFYVSKTMRDFMRLGVDFIFSDMSYTQYKVRFLEEPKEWDKTLHDFNFGIQAGLCLTMIPTDHFAVTPYLRYAPVFHYYNSGDLNETVLVPLGLNVGVRTVYRFIGLGIESHWSKCKLAPLFTEYYAHEASDLSSKMWNMRVYLSLNF